MEKIGVPQALIEHQKTVAQFALVVADQVVKIDGKKVDKQLVETGALLHDIGLIHCKGKTMVLKDYNVKLEFPEDVHLHPALGARFVKELGFPNEVVLAVLRHDLLNLSNEEYRRFGVAPPHEEDSIPQTTEEKVVLLGDMTNWLLKTEGSWKDPNSVTKSITPTLDLEFRTMTGRPMPEHNPVFPRARGYQVMLAKYLSQELVSGIRPI